MHRTALVAVALTAWSCGSPASASHPGIVDVRVSAEPSSTNAAPRVTPDAAGPLPPGAVASPPRADWPCEIAITLDGGEEELLQFDYGAQQHCVLPADLVTTGVIGCPDDVRAYRPPVDDLRYHIHYTYDANGRLASMQDGEAAPHSIEWGAALVDHADPDRVYRAREGGFEIVEGDHTVCVADVKDGRLVHAIRSYQPLDHQLEETIVWKGRRIARIESGGDVLEPRYDCVADDRSGWVKPD